ncbi:MAG: hypothetical protein RMM30_00740 [Armatimonadota bacterium]|nr:hypothetical protein [Armatimonadota bacterium]MDW8155104.1 hypothetical protein [Armatimonadota bacterium]
MAELRPVPAVAPLRTHIPGGVLLAMATVSLAEAAGIATHAALTASGWVLAFAPADLFLVLAHNLEW